MYYFITWDPKGQAWEILSQTCITVLFKVINMFGFVVWVHFYWRSVTIRTSIQLPRIEKMFLVSNESLKLKASINLSACFFVTYLISFRFKLRSTCHAVLVYCHTLTFIETWYWWMRPVKVWTIFNKIYFDILITCLFNNFEFMFRLNVTCLMVGMKLYLQTLLKNFTSLQEQVKWNKNI